MRIFLFLSFMLSFSGIAQVPFSQAVCDVMLQVKSEEGTNGLAVAYNPTARLYYSVFAGNGAYPLEVHNLNGESIYQLEIGYDVRGMWYDPKTKSLEGITYNNEGGFVFNLNQAGEPEGSRLTDFSYGMDAQSVGVYAEKLKMVMFAQNGTVSFFKKGKAGVKKQVVLSLPGDVGIIENAPMYTGIKGFELAFLDQNSALVHYFNGKTGSYSGSTILNIGKCAEVNEWPWGFRVSYCNNRVFIFDVLTRTWTGYKLI